MTKEELRTWRKQQGVTQQVLATALGVKKLAVSRWERGERGIPGMLPLAVKGLEITGLPEITSCYPSDNSQLGPQSKYKEAAAAKKEQQKPPEPWSCANQMASVAIGQLNRIPDDDPHRQEAFQRVMNWCTAQLNKLAGRGQNKKRRKV